MRHPVWTGSREQGLQPAAPVAMDQPEHVELVLLELAIERQPPQVGTAMATARPA
jgi:hypothetical protein